MKVDNKTSKAVVVSIHRIGNSLDYWMDKLRVGEAKTLGPGEVAELPSQDILRIEDKPRPRYYKASISLLCEAENIEALNAELMADGEDPLTLEDIEKRMGEVLFVLIQDLASGDAEFDFNFEIIDSE